MFSKFEYGVYIYVCVYEKKGENMFIHVVSNYDVAALSWSHILMKYLVLGELFVQ